MQLFLCSVLSEVIVFVDEIDIDCFLTIVKWIASTKTWTRDSQHKIARKVNVSRRPVQHIAKKLVVKNYKGFCAVNIPPGVRERRLVRSKKLLTRFPIRKVNLITFQDEKDFTLQVPTNRQNNRLYSRGKMSWINKSRLYHHWSLWCLALFLGIVLHNHFCGSREKQGD